MTARALPSPLLRDALARHRKLAIALLLLAAALALRMRDFGNPAVHVDEEYYLLVGDRMLHGALPYVDIWDRKPIGLFLIFAAVRMLPGDGILAYQLVATLFAAATAGAIALGGRRLGATPLGATIAAFAYLAWLSLLSGRGGQSPVFYNLFVAGAAVLTFRLPELAARYDRRAILLNGMAACLLAGLAIQTKYTPMVEGAFFGAAHLVYLRRAGARWEHLGGALLLWVAMGIVPTALVLLAYQARGDVAFQAFWFANFASVGLRHPDPATKLALRLAGTTTHLSMFAICAFVAWRERHTNPALTLAFGWLGAALIGFAMIGAFFDHYALPLLVPLTMIAATVLGRHVKARIAVLGAGAVFLVFHVAVDPADGDAVRSAARAVAANSGDECPYVFAGDAILYHLAQTCLPTAYAFPSTLAYEPERGASGVNETREVARIMANRPPVVVTMDRPMAPWNAGSAAIVERELRSEYQLLLTVPRAGAHLLVYVRRGRILRR